MKPYCHFTLHVSRFTRMRLFSCQRIRSGVRQLRDIYDGIFLVPYRAEMHREFLRRRDLFLLLGCSDLLGVPNPVAFYTLELYPELIEEFHEWHLRMGMPHAPDGGFRCC